METKNKGIRRLKLFENGDVHSELKNNERVGANMDFLKRKFREMVQLVASGLEHGEIGDGRDFFLANTRTLSFREEDFSSGAMDILLEESDLKDEALREMVWNILVRAWGIRNNIAVSLKEAFPERAPLATYTSRGRSFREYFSS